MGLKKIHTLICIRPHIHVCDVWEKTSIKNRVMHQEKEMYEIATMFVEKVI